MLRMMCFAVLLFLMLWAPAIGAEPAGRTLYRKTLPGDRELLVIQEPLVSAAVLAGLYTPQRREPVGAFSLTVELRSAALPPLRLWSQTGSCTTESEYAEYEVLDLIMLPNRVFMAIATPGGGIAVTQVGILSRSRDIGLGGFPPWNMVSGSIPNRPGRLGARLFFNEKQNRLEAEVTDHLQGVTQHTYFEQHPENSELVPVKQWQEHVPDLGKGQK